MSQFGQALLIAAVCVFVGGEQAHAATPAEDRFASLEGKLDWLADDWQAPDGSHYHVAGLQDSVGVAGHFPFHGMIELSLLGSYTPIFRTDTNEDLQRLGGRLQLGWSQERYHPVPLGERYSINWGLGMLGDAQWHLTSAPPQGRARDYLDERQLRVGPYGQLKFLWLHPTDEAWRAHLDLLIAPRLIAVTSGNVPFPSGWTVVEASFGPSWRWRQTEVFAGAEGRLWLGGNFVQRAGGLVLRANQLF